MMIQNVPKHEPAILCGAWSDSRFLNPAMVVARYVGSGTEIRPGHTEWEIGGYPYQITTMTQNITQFPEWKLMRLTKTIYEND